MEKITINKKTVQHIVWILEERGVGHCQFCTAMLKSFKVILTNEEGEK